MPEMHDQYCSDFFTLRWGCIWMCPLNFSLGTLQTLLKNFIINCIIRGSPFDNWTDPRLAFPPSPQYKAIPTSFNSWSDKPGISFLAPSTIICLRAFSLPSLVVLLFSIDSFVSPFWDSFIF